jgi:hypothetical protein
MSDLFIGHQPRIPQDGSRRLVAWITFRGPLGRAFTDPSLPGAAAAGVSDLIDAVMIPRRLKQEQEAAGIEAMKRAGRETWRVHQQREEVP